MISVAMATYNGEKFLKEQLDSIFSQTMPIDELVICDDCSKDKTIEIIQSYQKRYPIKLFQNEKNLGYKLNFKEAMDYSSGDFIFLCDQDDIWMKDKVEKMISKIQGNSKIQALASSFVYIDSKENELPVKLEPGKSNNNFYFKPVEKGDCVRVEFEEFYNHNYFQGCSLVITKALKNQVITHFSTMVAHDYLINFTAALNDGMYFWNIPLFKYRLHGKNTIGVQDINAGLIQKMRNRNTFYLRTVTAKDGIKMLLALQESNPSFYNQRKEYYDKKIQFYKEHINVLKERKFFRLLLENMNPYYREFKGLESRGMDLLYAIMG